MRLLKVEKAFYEGDFKVRLLFNDGVDTIVNFGSWIRENLHPQYKRYLNESNFKKFYIDDFGNIAWGKNRDLYFPIEQLHNGFLLNS